ncbi:MAG: sigma-54 dependent transcriptional regulator [Deltaproteobacteria bacterium]
MAKPKALIVDDEKGVRESLRLVLQDDFDPVTVDTGEAALEWLASERATVVFLDILMPGIDGLEVLETLRARDADTPVVMLTATKTVKTAVKAMKLGAFDYITKPFDVDEIRIVAQRAADTSALKREVRRLRGEVGQRYSVENIIGRAPCMQELFETIERVAPMKTTVLVTGESGTGKELFAKALHYGGPRAGHSMVTLNCAAIPESLLESELFGHEKGSFTDAHERKLGQFEHADGGTIFLDEIGEMSPALQAKMLRVLEQGEIRRVGGDKPILVDVRVVAATNRDLIAAIEEDRFRADLYYRLNVVSIEVPPLRERLEDVPSLIAHFVERKSDELKVPRRELSPAVVDALLAHTWPGNVRELENVIERMMVLVPGNGTIDTNHLPGGLLDGARPGNGAAGAPRELVLAGQTTLADAVDEFEREIIGEALERVRFNQTRAAEKLGTTRRILKYRMDKLGIEAVEN